MLRREERDGDNDGLWLGNKPTEKNQINTQRICRRGDTEKRQSGE